MQGRASNRKILGQVRIIGMVAISMVFVVACALRGQGQDAETLAVSASRTPIELSPTGSEVELVAIDDGTTSKSSMSAQARLKSLTRLGGQAYLKLLDVRAQSDPGVTYNVYLNLPSKTPPSGVKSPYYVGTFSFFNAPPGRSTNLAFNITPHVERLITRRELETDVRLTITPSGEPDPDAAPQIGKVIVTVR